MVKKWFVPVGAILILCIVVFIAYIIYEMVTEEPTYPEVTATAYAIDINEDYRFVQTSGEVCTFMRVDEETAWKFLVEDAEYVNWDDNYVIIQGYDKTYYIYSFASDNLMERKRLSEFQKLKAHLSIEMELRDKEDFEHVPI